MLFFLFHGIHVGSLFLLLLGVLDALRDGISVCMELPKRDMLDLQLPRASLERALWQPPMRLLGEE